MSDEEEPGTRPDWADLTRECLINAFSRLTLAQRWRGPMLACRSWMSAATDPSLFSAFDLDPYFDASPETAIWWGPEFERRVDYMLRSAVVWSRGELTLIRARHCSDASLSLVADRCPKLEVLSIQSCPRVTDAGMSQISFKCVNLRELDLSYCYEVSHESLVLVGKSCPNLSVFKRNFMNWLDPSQHAGIVPSEYLNACPQDGDSEAAAIGQFMPHLVHLEIRFLKLSAKGLAVICGGCKNLEYLDLYGCANLRSRDIANATAELKGLKEVKKFNHLVPRSGVSAERYGHWRLYDERFQTDSFRI